MVQITLKHLLVPNGYIPGMSLIYSSLHRCTFVHTGSMFALFNIVCFTFCRLLKRRSLRVDMQREVRGDRDIRDRM